MTTYRLPTPEEFAVGPTGLTHARSQMLAVIAAASYNISRAGVQATELSFRFKGWRVHGWNLGCNQGLVLSGDDAVVVVFAGTNHLDDWKQNLRAIGPKPLLGGNAHRGFLTVLGQGLNQALRLPESPLRPLFITGHSLGGAVATAFAATLHQENHPWASQAHVVTFGAPRLGSEPFMNSYEKMMEERHWFYANSRDPVPKVPPRKMGFRHVGRLFYFNRENDLLEPAPESVGLQAESAILSPEEAARAEWKREEDELPPMTNGDAIAEYLARVLEDPDLADSEAILTERGELRTIAPTAELQGEWIAGRHFMNVYLDNLQSAS